MWLRSPGVLCGLGSGLPTLGFVDPTELVQTGPLILAVGFAVLAGTVSFASPCVIPLVPGYLAYLAGLVGADAPAVDTAETTAGLRRGRWRVAGAALLFMLGFTAVFVIATVGVLGLSDALALNEPVLRRLGGVVTVLMGLVFLGVFPALQRDVRVRRVPRGGLWGAPALGAVFGLGWTPCLSPTLTGVVSLAYSTQWQGGAALRGVVLVLVYCLGLGIPFVVLALGARWAVRGTGWLRRHSRTIQWVGGLLLILVGLLLVTGLWGSMIASLRAPINGFELPI
ncbi:cytochrome c-type biogenesis protein [Actinopolyspora mzabensis]|uniref:Cytochrome c-type biogenesis protein n=1 Tax=Actinopolyspora mzabensis TaxID=995066 RepID=A0A1G8WSR2_ACTMZ|nr:cytochrome c-type biogenesis protein [Actinopolyspora mzabensis]